MKNTKRKNWLPIGASIGFKILLLTFKNLNDLSPSYLTSLLLKYKPPRLLRSSNRLLLQDPSVNTVAYGSTPLIFILCTDNLEQST